MPSNNSFVVFSHVLLPFPLFLLCFFSYLYQIAHLGDNDDEPEFSSAEQLEEGETFFFVPRTLTNLVQVDEMESLSPVMSCQVSCGRVGKKGTGWLTEEWCDYLGVFVWQDEEKWKLW